MNAECRPRKRVLHILNSFGTGGVEMWLLTTVKYLHSRPELGVTFDFLLTGGKPGVFDEELKANGCNVFYAKYSLYSISRFGKKLRAVLKEKQYDVIHDHEDFVSGWHYLLGKRYLPDLRISHLHNSYRFVQNYISNPLRWISFQVGRKLMAKSATKITGTSESVMDAYGYNRPPFKNKRIYATYCGFDTEKFKFDKTAKSKLCNELGWTYTDQIALFIGRISVQNGGHARNEKNPEFAFELAMQLVTENSNWKFLFVGYKGETGDFMEMRAKRMGLERQILFLGVRQDIPTIMSACDVLIFPSLWEGLGMVAVEGQCNGLTVIMSDSIPKEAIVCPELVKIKSLEESRTSWVREIIGVTPVTCRLQFADKVRQSVFSIENSVNRLLQIYGC